MNPEYISNASPDVPFGEHRRVEIKMEESSFDKRSHLLRDGRGDVLRSEKYDAGMKQEDGIGGDIRLNDANACSSGSFLQLRAFGGDKKERLGREDEAKNFGELAPKPRSRARIGKEEEASDGRVGAKREIKDEEGNDGLPVHGYVLEKAESGDGVQVGASGPLKGAERGAVKKEKEREENENARENEGNTKKIAIGKRTFGKRKGKGKGTGKGTGRKRKWESPKMPNEDDDDDDDNEEEEGHDDDNDNDAMDQEEPRASLGRGTVKRERRRSSESDSESSSYYSSSDSCSYYYSSEEEESRSREKRPRETVVAEGRGPLTPPLKRSAHERTHKFKIRGRGKWVKWDDEDTGALVEALRLYPCGDGRTKKYTLPKRGNKLHGRHHAISLYIADTTGILRSEKQVRIRLATLRKEYGNAIPELVAGGDVADPWVDPAVNAALVEAARLYPPCGVERFRIDGAGDRKYGRNEAIARYIEVKTGVKRSNQQVQSRLDYLKKKNGDDPVLGHAAYDAADPHVVDPWGDPAVNAALVEAARLYPPCGKEKFKIEGGGNRKYGRNEAISRYIELKTGVKRSSQQVKSRLQNLKKKNGDDPVLGHAAYDAADPNMVDLWGDPAVNAALIEAAGLYPPCGKERFRIDGAGDRKYGRNEAIARYIELKTGVKRSNMQVADRLKNLKKKNGDDPVLGHAAYDTVRDPDMVDPWGDPAVNAALIEAAGLYPPCGGKRFRIDDAGDRKYGRSEAIARYIEVKTGVKRSNLQVQSRLDYLKKKNGDDPVLGQAAYDAVDPGVVDPWGDPAVNTALVEAAGLYPPCGNEKFRIEGGGDRKYGRNEAIARYIEVKTDVKRSNQQVRDRLRILKKKNGDDPVLGHAAYDTVDPDVVDPWGDPAVSAALVEAAGLYPLCGKNERFRIDGAGDRKYGRNEAIAHYIEVKTGVSRSTKQVKSRLQYLKKK